MPVQECSLTITNQEFLPEIISNKDTIRPKVTNITNLLLQDGSLPNEKETIAYLGEIDGKWDFWDRLYSVEKDTVFNYTPFFLIPDLEIKLDNEITDFYPLSDYKVSPRILYYPFGLFVVRLRIYLKFSRKMSVDGFIEFQRNIEDNLYIVDLFNNISEKNEDKQYQNDKTSWTHSIKNLDQKLTVGFLKECLHWAFGDPNSSGPLPDFHTNQLENDQSYRITYLYQSPDVDDSDIASIISEDTRSFSYDREQRLSSPQFGNFTEDMLVVNHQGAAIVTPYFWEISPNNRRWKRLQLLNNFYLGSDMARFERQYGGSIVRELDELLDQISKGKLAGDPLVPKYLVMMREALTLGSRLRGARYRVYEELEPEQKHRHLEEIESYLDRIVDHDSKLREAIKQIAPRLI